MTDLPLAILHHLLAFALLGVLAAEMAITTPGLAGARLKRLQMLDRWYGILAGLLIVVGVLRVLYGGKGAEFYVASAAFWAKMAAFAAVGLLSIGPTVRIIGWGRRARADAGFAVPADEVRQCANGSARSWRCSRGGFGNEAARYPAPSGAGHWLVHHDPRDPRRVAERGAGDRLSVELLARNRPSGPGVFLRRPGRIVRSRPAVVEPGFSASDWQLQRR
jgi:putative membrane protein